MEMKHYKLEKNICKNCPRNKKNTVFGYGNLEAKLMLIGRDPGSEEEKIGKPFVGRSGQLLTEVMYNSKIYRDEIYITNLVKCRKGNNKKPTEKTIEICSEFLEKEILKIKPKIIVPLGRLSIEHILNRKIKIVSSVINRIYIIKKYSNIDDFCFYVYPMYHPSYIARNRSKKNNYQKNFNKLKLFLQKIKDK